MRPANEMLQALPVAVYTTDAEGRIDFYNSAARELFGCHLEPATGRQCAAWQILATDGTPLPHEDSPVALALRQGRTVKGTEAVVERPDGTRVPVAVYASPLRDAEGRIVGAISLLVSTADHAVADLTAAQLAAIVQGSDDAIVGKTLEGIVQTWNDGATRIFGYEPEEIIGQSITRIIPPELHDEEREILAKLRRGERVEHFETTRITKDGRRLAMSLSVSPVRDRTGTVVGASKIGRDVTERKRAEELQTLLFEELNHRVKNMLATIQAIASQSMRRAASSADFVSSFNGRVQALARAHDLLVHSKMKGAEIGEIVSEQVLLGSASDPRVTWAGPAVLFDARAAVHLALVLHELATNARRYGALSVPSGRVSITWRVEAQEPGEFSLQWRESGVPNVSAPTTHGFGTTLIERTLHSSGGQARISYEVGGITCNLTLPLSEIRPVNRIGMTTSAGAQRSFAPSSELADLHGKHILVVEDEPLVAIETESELRAAGCTVIGPAGNIAAAERLLAEHHCDAALIDVNLAGRPVDRLAAALVDKRVPFAFATGYGREGLPPAFRAAPALTKPFTREQLLSMLRSLLSQRRSSDNVVRLKQPNRSVADD